MSSKVAFWAAVLGLLVVGCAVPLSPQKVDSVTITFSSPQDPTFLHKVSLRPDTLQAFDSRSAFLMHVPDAVTQIEVDVVEPASSQGGACASVEFAQRRPGTSTYEITDQSSRYHVVLPKPEAPEKEFYAANILVRFCGLVYSGYGLNYSKRTYFLGLWYGPEQLLAVRAKDSNAVPIGVLEQSVYVR